MTRQDDSERDRKRAARIAGASYEVGWGKAPVEHRFKKGEKQTFIRRKKRKENVSDIVQRLANEKIRGDLNGVPRTFSALELSLRKVRKMAIDGHLKAMQLWFELAIEAGRGKEQATNYDYSAELRRKIEDMAAKYKQNEALFINSGQNVPKT